MIVVAQNDHRANDITSNKFRMILRQLARFIANSIAFGSAPRRETVSQLDRPAVSQKHTLWVFCQWQTRVQAVGRTTGLRIGSGRMAMQAAEDGLVGGSNPGAANTAAAPPPASTHQDSNRRPKNLRLGAYHSIPQMCLLLLGAFSAKTFHPPHPPPLKKVLSSFRG